MTTVLNACWKVAILDDLLLFLDGIQFQRFGANPVTVIDSLEYDFGIQIMNWSALSVWKFPVNLAVTVSCFRWDLLLFLWFFSKFIFLFKIFLVNLVLFGNIKWAGHWKFSMMYRSPLTFFSSVCWLYQICKNNCRRWIERAWCFCCGIFQNFSQRRTNFFLFWLFFIWTFFIRHLNLQRLDLFLHNRVYIFFHSEKEVLEN